MTVPQFYIGIEGIGMRQSIAALCDKTGVVHSAFRLLEPISLHTTPPDLLIERITFLLRAVLHQTNRTLKDLANASVSIGLTGVTFRYDREIILPQILERRNSGLPVSDPICTGDAEIVFASHTACPQGSALICHSGSTAYAVCLRNGILAHTRVGGWGPAIGDEGSGYWLGQQALRMIGKEHDGHENYSILWEETEKWLQSAGIDDPEVEAWQLASSAWNNAHSVLTRKVRSGHPEIDPRTIIFYFAHTIIHEKLPKREGIEAWRRIVSGLASPLIRAAEAKDPKAEYIVGLSINSLCAQFQQAIKIAVKENGFNVISPLVLYGGVVSHHPYFRNLLIQSIKKTNPEIPEIKMVSPTTMRPVCGALLFALGGSRTGALRLPDEQIIEALRESSQRFDALRNE